MYVWKVWIVLVRAQDAKIKCMGEREGDHGHGCLRLRDMAAFKFLRLIDKDKPYNPTQNKKQPSTLDS